MLSFSFLFSGAEGVGVLVALCAGGDGGEGGGCGDGGEGGRETGDRSAREPLCLQ